MTYDEIVTMIKLLQSSLDSLRATTEAKKQEVDANQLLVGARQYGSARVDPVVGAGTPTTVTLPKTGHTLSVARTDLGEGFVGYCTRIADQAGGNPNTVGALFLGTSHLFERFGGYKADGSNWPQAADYFYNIRAYMTPEELARDDAAKRGWDEYDERVKARVQAASGGFRSQPELPEGETPL
jgi:hypothetical protein